MSTKIKCSAIFEVSTTNLMQLDNIDFFLGGKDEAANIVINNELVNRYVREILSFEICKKPTFIDPNQTNLPL